jgi:hypothetical protein
VSDSLHDFLHWGPYGLYATFVLMLLALPLGWLYAYVAFVGYRRDITQPDPQRARSAVGGAILIGLLIFIFRHVFTSDPFLRPAWEEYRHILDWTFKLSGSITRSILDWVVKQHDESGFLGRIFWGLLAGALGVVLFALVLISVFAMWALVAVAIITIFVLSGTTVLGSVPAGVIAFPGFLLGLPILLYFLFVRLPLQVAYRRAIREGRWPTTDELVRALAQGTLNKTDWQSKIMAYKSQRFEADLDNEAARIAKKKVRSR